MSRRLAVVAHGVEDPAPPPEEADTLAQAALFGDVLSRRGWRVETMTLGLDLADARERLRAAAPDLVVNLVESLGGRTSMLPAAALLFDELGLRYTGSGAAALHVTTDKPAAKRVMRAAGIPTPDWVERGGGAARDGRWIVKPADDDASAGITSASVVDARDVPAMLARPRRWYAERFIDGRELNVTLLERAGEPVVLPVAEMTFDGWPEGAPRIVDHAAKWDEASPQARALGRSYDHAAADAKLVERAAALALACWRVFGLRGYARVDLRVDAAGEPFVLEVNANPCLAPDAGFAAAAAQAGLALDAAIVEIAEAALRG